MRYTEETAHRLCALLLELLHNAFPDEKVLTMFRLLGIPRPNYPSSVMACGDDIDFFTLGGLEVFRDVIT